MPVAAYNVSGEFSMVKAATEKKLGGWCQDHDGNTDLHKKGWG